MNPIILLHGALGASAQLTPLKQALESSGCEVHVLDFSGHGGSPYRASFGIEAFAEDVKDYIGHQLHGRSADVFGYSMGGYVALHLAHQHPAYIHSVVTLGTKFDWSPESAEKEIRKMNADKIVEKVPAFARLLQTRHAPNDWRVLLSKTGEMMQSLGTNPLLTTEVMKSLTLPTLILLGDADDMADRAFSEQVAHHLANGQFELLANTPHPLEKVDHDVLQNRILNFFKS